MAADEISPPALNPFSPAYIRRETSVAEDAAAVAHGTYPGPVKGVTPLPGVDPAAAQWEGWSRQQRRLHWRANLSLTLAGLAFAGLGYLYYFGQFMQGPWGVSPPYPADVAGIDGAGGSGPFSAGRHGGAGDLGQPSRGAASEAVGASSSSSAGWGSPPTGGDQIAEAQGSTAVGGNSYAELELQLLRLTSRVAALEQAQHALDQALAGLRFDRLDKANDDPGEAQ